MNKRIRIILIIVSLSTLLFTFILLLNYYFVSPRIISSNIENEDSFDINSNIVVNFDKNTQGIQKEQINIISSSVELGWVYESRGKAIIISPSNNLSLVPYTTYEIQITPKSLNGRLGKTQSLIFTTGGGEISTYLDNVLTNNTDLLEDGMEEGHEIIKYLPENNNYFKMDYIPLKDGKSVQYEVVLKNDTEVSKDKFLEWLNSKNFKEEDISITYY